MRYIDIAVAAMIGVSAVAGLVSWAPETYDASAHRASIHSALLRRLDVFVRNRGTVWLVRSSPGTVCAALASASNSTVALTGSVGGESCGDAPPDGAVTASLSFLLAGREIVFVAWCGEGA